MIVTCTVAIYYWNEMVSTRRQLDIMKEEYYVKTQNKFHANHLVAVTDRAYQDFREPKVVSESRVDIQPPNTKTIVVDNLGEDILLVNSEKRNPAVDKMLSVELPLLQKGKILNIIFIVSLIVSII